MQSLEKKQTLGICAGNMHREYASEIYNWEYALGICFGSMLWEYAAEICSGTRIRNKNNDSAKKNFTISFIFLPTQLFDH